MKYTREDVIYTREQAEKAGLKTGSECYFGDKPSEAIINANNDNYLRHLSEIDWECELPFKDGLYGIYWECVILKKEPEKKIVPFDFSLKEDRDAVAGKRIERDNACYYDESIIIGFHNQYAILCFGGCKTELVELTGSDLKNIYVFADTGKPVGKEVEV